MSMPARANMWSREQQEKVSDALPDEVTIDTFGRSRLTLNLETPCKTYEIPTIADKARRKMVDVGVPVYETPDVTVGYRGAYNEAVQLVFELEEEDE